MVVPDAGPFGGYIHVDWLSLAPVRAEVTASVLELFQVFDGVCSTGGGHRPHTKWQWHLLGKVIQQCIKAFEATFVDGHPDAPKLAVAAFVEGDPLCRGSSGHMGES